MDIPLCVLECTDPELRDMAISAFARGTEDDQDYFMTRCLLLQMSSEERDNKETRLTKYKEWLSYIQLNVVVDQSHDGNPTGLTNLNANFSSILDNKTLDTA